jgi:hypothetical protein
MKFDDESRNFMGLDVSRVQTNHDDVWPLDNLTRKSETSFRQLRSPRHLL